MKRFFHTVGTFFAACLTGLLVLGCARTPEDTTQREIEAISQMRELCLVEYRVRKIVKADDEGEWYKIGDRKILLSCTAYLKAGIDLSGFSAENVDINRLDGSVTVTVPHAKLLSLDIPASEIREEYDHVTMLRHSFSAEERNALLRQGEKQIRSSVPSLGILEKAEEYNRTSGKPFRLSFSIGTYRAEESRGETMDDSIKKADAFMYRIKTERKAGR